MPGPSFHGLRVLLLESRRAKELASIVSSYGGTPQLAPSMREVPLETNTEALQFADRLIAGDFDMVVWLTGVGTRALVEVVERVHGTREPLLAALSRVKVVARGPKPVAVLRELAVPVWLTAPEPNTWRELLAALDNRSGEFPLQGVKVAVQEYGAENPDLCSGLEARGAVVTSVPVYRWALPEDLEPLHEGIRALANGTVDVVIFTTGTQAAHLFQVAASMGLEGNVRDALTTVVLASIGPTTSDELRARGLTIDLEASHPKMGYLVREAAERSQALLDAKRAARR